MYAARRQRLEPKNPTGLCMCGCGTTTATVTRRKASRGYQEGDHLAYLPGHHMQGTRVGWKGGRYISQGGYVMVYVEPNRYMAEHRLVMEQILGRPLARNEHVHHINGIKHDNRPENLVVLTHSEHLTLHGATGIKRFYVEHPEARSANGRAAAQKNTESMSERGKKGAASRWNKSS
jgi:uncharacterized protein (DUF1330 family)